MNVNRSVKIPIVIIVLLLILNAGSYSGTMEVAVAGSTEKIETLKKNDIDYFSFSELVEFLGGQLDWETIGHRIRYTDQSVHMDFTIGSPFFSINDSVFNLTYPALFSEGMLFLPPLTFISFLDQVSPQKITYSQNNNSLRIDSEYFNVSDLSIDRKANGLLIEIYLTTTLAYEIFLTEGNWINVSIRDGHINSPRILSRKDSRYMYRLKTHQAAGSGQVSFRLKRNVENWHHKLEFDPPRIQISIADNDFDIEQPDTTPLIGPDNMIDVIVIDPGHGGNDYGAIGQNGTREKDVVLSISKELARLIRKDKQFQVIMTRDQDKTLSLQERADIANNASADLFISIHANSSLKRKVRGWNVFFLATAKNDSARAVAQLENSVFLREQQIASGQEDDIPDADPILSILNEMIMTEFQEESHDFALMADREMRRQLNIPARGVDQAGFFVLNMVFTPSVLVESGFISNKTEEKLLKDKKYQKKVAKALYNAIKRFKAKYESS